jgi:hypothetical protein
LLEGISWFHPELAVLGVIRSEEVKQGKPLARLKVTTMGLSMYFSGISLMVMSTSTFFPVQELNEVGKPCQVFLRRRERSFPTPPGSIRDPAGPF